MNNEEDKQIGFLPLVNADGTLIDVGQYTNIPPKSPKRNKHGLMEGVNYKFKENGRVDWRAMIKPEFLVFNREKQKEIETKYKKNLSDLTPSDLEDKDKDKYLLILLAGIRDLLHLRGCYSVNTTMDYVSDNKSCATTKIQWAVNYEKECQESTGVASASLNNTSGFGKYFLESIAENRSLVRAVRQYLEINIIGQDEVKLGVSDTDGTNNDKSEEITPSNMLEKWVTKAKLDFETFKNRVGEKYKDQVTSDSAKWSKYSDIPPQDCYTLIGLLEGALEKVKEENTSTEKRGRGRPAKTS